MKESIREQIENTLRNMSCKKFIVRDLFVGAIFDDIPLNERLQIGKDFLEYAKQNENRIKILFEDNEMSKTDLGQQVYCKI